LIPCTLAEVAIGAEHLKIADIEGEFGELGTGLDMIDVQGFATYRTSAAALAGTAVESERLIPDSTPIV
jgi:hypothetical protein